MERLFSADRGGAAGRGMRLVAVLSLLAGLGLTIPLLAFGQASGDAAKPGEAAKPEEPAKPAEPAAAADQPEPPKSPEPAEA